MNPGDKVTFFPRHGEAQKGIVKSIQSEEFAFVVYNCGGDWKNYQDYTGVRTPIVSLQKGWN